MAVWNIYCVPESVYKNISHHLFDYEITFINLHTNFKGDFVHRKMVSNVHFKDFWYIIYIFDSDLVWRMQLMIFKDWKFALFVQGILNL